jgi:glycosyltransferase involved in cell wall biosynthesis
MKKIKVLHTITRMIVGGAQENTMLTVDLLDKNRYEVDILCGLQTGAEGSLLEECRQRGLTMHRSRFLVREISPLRDLIHLIETVRFLKKGRYDIIHTHSAKAGVIHRIAAKIAGVPVIIGTVHGWSFHDRMSRIKKWAYAFIENLAARYSDKIIAVTDYDIDKGLSEKVGRREQYVTIHSAIEIERYRRPSRNVADIREELGIRPDHLVIGTVSRMSPQKAPLDFVRIAADICARHPKIQFLFIGDGPMHAEVKALVREKRIEDKILLPGLRKDVPDMLAVMDIFILTSLWEGLPRVFSQAMAAHLPIVATRVDGAPEAIRDTVSGYLTDPGKPGQMVKKLEILINQPEKRTSMATAGQDILDPGFNVYRMVEDIDTLYRKILKQKSIPVP